MNRTVGKSIPRLEDPALLIGKGRYIDDIRLADVLHCTFVRSTAAHALLKKIDIEAARQMPGVYAVLTASDLAAVLTSPRMPLGASTAQTQNSHTPFVLQDKEVAYVGEPIAIVVANSRAEAEDAMVAVEIEYENLPVVTDPRHSGDSGVPVVRNELKNNILNTFSVGFGDVGKAFAEAAHVFSDEIWQHRGCGTPMENRGVVTEVRLADGDLTVWSSTQMPHDVFYTLIGMLGMDENRIRVITPDVGGGFGPKYCLYPEEIAIPAAAKLLARNLKWIEDRRENFLSAAQEREQLWNTEIALDAEAKILGIRGTLIHDQGAYTPKAVNQPYNSATSMTGPYIVPTYNMDVTIVMTNKVPASSVRGAGYPQAVFTMERMLDLAATRLGLDRAEIRRRNLIPPDKMPYEKKLTARSGASMIYDGSDYVAAQADALAAADWAGFPARQKAALSEGRYIGIGIANAVKGTGRGPFESGTVRVAQNGKINVYTGATAMGQGIATALAQICAEQLGVSPDDVTVVAGDTRFEQYGLGGFASRQLVTAGSSVHLAAKSVAAKAIQAASTMLQIEEEKLELEGGRVRVKGGNQSIGLGEIAQALRGAPGFAFAAEVGIGLESSMRWRTDALTYANACHVVEVEVDVELGNVVIKRYVAFHDSGRRINPMIVDGQVIGGIAHGVGNALFEYFGYDDTGQPVTTTLQEYLLVTATELPHFETIYKETPSAFNPIGVKGVGEAGTIPAAAAIISAVENALSPFAVRISRTPVPPETLFNLIRSARH
jgi:carbon-monoxide dehydrogenase large subunit